MPVARLACVQCQQRKRRCNRQHPCAACFKNGLDCIIVERSRLPRGSSSKLTTGKLGERLPNRGGVQSASTTSSASISEDHVSAMPRSSQPGWYGQHEEVMGVREIMNYEIGPSELNTSGDVFLEREHHLQQSTLDFAGLDQYGLLGNTTATLIDVYEQQIDPILKVIHMPSLRQSLLDRRRPYSVPQQAVVYAVQFSACCVLDDVGCMEVVGEQRSSLCHKLRRQTESLLAATELYTTPSLPSLQAFVIYLIGLRASEGWQAVWARLATGIRLAQSLRLHEPNRSSSTYAREIGVRLWHSLCVLDMQAALDGGLFSGSANKAPLGHGPLHVNDSDLSPESHGKLEARQGFTDMTFPLMSFTALKMIRKLVNVHVDDDGRPIVAQSWTERFSLADEGAHELSQKFLVHCDCTIDFQYFTRVVGDGMLLTVRLLVRRPIHRFFSDHPPPDGDTGVLELALEILEQGQRKYSKPVFSLWKWFAWSKWYTLAIVLTELCHCRPGPLRDRAWAVAETAYTFYKQSERSGPLLNAMERLRQKAERHRSTSHDSGEDFANTESDSQFFTQPMVTGSTVPLATTATSCSWDDWDEFLVEAMHYDHLNIA